MEEIMISKFKFVLAFVFFMSTITGCASMMRGNSGKPLEPARTLRFSDIPVPAGFKLMPQQSYSFENEGIRVAFLKYSGRGTLDQALNFYKDQMPLSKWNLLNISEFGTRLLNFERDGETCIITMETLPLGGTIVSLSIGPKSSGIKNRRLQEEPLK
jgi:hypothetical protein